MVQRLRPPRARSRRQHHPRHRPADTPPATEARPATATPSHTTDGVPVRSGTRFVFLAAASRYAVEPEDEGRTVDWEGDGEEATPAPEDTGGDDPVAAEEEEDDWLAGGWAGDWIDEDWNEDGATTTAAAPESPDDPDLSEPPPADRRRYRHQRPRPEWRLPFRPAAWQAGVVALVLAFCAAVLVWPRSVGIGTVAGAPDDSVLGGGPTTAPHVQVSPVTAPVAAPPAVAPVHPVTRPAPTTTTTTWAPPPDTAPPDTTPAPTTPDTTVPPTTAAPATTTPTTARPWPTWPSTTRPPSTTTTTEAPTTSTTDPTTSTTSASTTTTDVPPTTAP